jgi:hypothetical protein
MALHVLTTIELTHIHDFKLNIVNNEMRTSGWTPVEGFAATYSKSFPGKTSPQKALLDARECVDNALHSADWNKSRMICTVSTTKPTVLEVDPWSDQDTAIPEKKAKPAAKAASKRASAKGKTPSKAKKAASTRR